MDPFRFVADGVVSAAPLRKASRTDHYYGLALSRSRSAPSSARRGIGGIQVPSKRQRHRHWLRRSRAMPFVVRSPFVTNLLFLCPHFSVVRTVLSHGWRRYGFFWSTGGHSDWSPRC